MRCRPTQSAAQSLQHLWITDSVLSEAFHRFARVSQAHSHHRRHGSNIPGPLEARRRLARRRMGMMTLDHVGGGMPLAEEAGVLFGFGRQGQPIGTEFAKGWKYQAPYPPTKLGQEKSPTNRRLPEQHWPGNWSDGSPWDVEQQSSAALKEDARLNAFLQVPEQVAKDDKAMLDEVLASLSDKEGLSEARLESIYRILEATLEEPGPDNIMSILSTLNSHHVEVQTWERLASIVQRKVDCGALVAKDVLSILEFVAGRYSNWQAPTFAFASEIKVSGSMDSLEAVTNCIISSSKLHTKTRSWLWYLQERIPMSRSGDLNKRTWTMFHRLLAHRFQPSDPHVAHHFGRMKQAAFAQVLLDYYLPIWLSEVQREAQSRGDNANDEGHSDTEVIESFSDKKSSTQHSRLLQTEIAAVRDALTLDYGHLKRIDTAFQTTEPASESESSASSYQAPGLLDTVLDQGLAMVTAQWKSMYSNSVIRSSMGLEIVDLVTLLQHHQIPSVRLLDEVFSVSMQTADKSATKNLFMKLRTQRKCGIPTTLAGRLVHHFLESGNIGYAFYVFRHVPSLPLLPYAELLLKLIEQGRTHGQKIFEMLQRYHPEERIPLQWRQHRRLNIKPEHVDLVHEVAYAFASSDHLSPRTAFRRVWECFRYLQDRKAPMRPLLSRAFVKAGISRPLEQRERLNEAQVKYIISIVNQIEGPEVAREVDRIVWDAWQWTLERQWSLALPRPAKGPGGQGKFYEKRRRLWTKEGGRIYMPFTEIVDPVGDEIETRDGNLRVEDTLHDAVEGDTSAYMPKGEAIEICKSSGSVSSVTDMNELMADLTTSNTPREEDIARDDQVLDEDEMELSVSEMNEVLSSPSEDTFKAVTAATVEVRARESITAEANEEPDKPNVELVPDVSGIDEPSDIELHHLEPLQPTKTYHLKLPEHKPTCNLSFPRAINTYHLKLKKPDLDMQQQHETRPSTTMHLRLTKARRHQRNQRTNLVNTEPVAHTSSTAKAIEGADTPNVTAATDTATTNESPRMTFHGTKLPKGITLHHMHLRSLAPTVTLRLNLEKSTAHTSVSLSQDA